MMNTRMLMAAALLAVAMSGCGSTSSSGSAMPPAAGPPPSPPPSVDAFTQAVQSLVASSSEASSVQDIDGIAAVDADVAEPIAIY